MNQELMKQDTQNGIKRVSVIVDQIQAFVIMNNVGMMINSGMYVTNDLFGILVIAIVNEILYILYSNYIVIVIMQ